MRQSPTQVEALVERLCRPQRVGVFGHRGVGKTTLLTMLYREAVSGRLPGLRLAAADARTAGYLADKIQQLESGQPLPATLAETDLRFHLYRGNVRLELHFKDYQGEHVELGREEQVGEFLRDCDAVWLCLDAAHDIDRLRRQMEIEQLLERYLAVEPHRVLDRPFALLLMRSDLLGPAVVDPQQWAEQRFEMVRHALQTHCEHNALFAVSSVHPNADGSLRLMPRNLDAPLTWLVDTLQAVDHTRMEWLWTHAGDQLPLLERSVACFLSRYPDSPQTAEHRQRLRQLRWRQRRNRALGVIAAAVAAVALLSGYDALGYRTATTFEREHASDPSAVLANWKQYTVWHPTRNWLWFSAQAEQRRFAELEQQAREQQRDAQYADLRRQAGNPDADPESVWQDFQTFHQTYPEVDIDGELKNLRHAIKTRRDEQLQLKAQRAYDELISSEPRTTDVSQLLAQADRFLREHGGTAHESDVRRRREAYLTRLDDRDIEFARSYSTQHPLNFATRREAYQRYLDRHPGGTATTEARTAVQTIDAEWDKHDFRAVRDHYLTRPGDVPELVARCRAYLAAHPRGRFQESAQELLRWTEKITAANDYKVTLRNGRFDRKIGAWLRRGPDLSVEIEVAGARYGPSNIVVNSFTPEWAFEFPQPIRWKLGDPVRILVLDHDWSKRVVLELSSGDDPMGMNYLSGEVWQNNNVVTFESNFRLPKVPVIE